MRVLFVNSLELRLTCSFHFHFPLPRIPPCHPPLIPPTLLMYAIPIPLNSISPLARYICLLNLPSPNICGVLFCPRKRTCVLFKSALAAYVESVLFTFPLPESESQFCVCRAIGTARACVREEIRRERATLLKLRPEFAFAFAFGPGASSGAQKAYA